MRAVNLLPSKPGRGGSLAAGGSRRTLAIAGAALLVAGVGYMAYSAHSEVSSLSDQVTAANDEKSGLDAQLATMVSVDQQASAQVARRGAVVTLASSRINWERIMRDTVTVLPEQVWLSELSGTAPAASAAPAAAAPAGQPQAVNSVPQGLHVEGFAFSQPQVAQLMARIEAVPGLGEPRLASAEKITRGARKIVQFVIDIPVDQRAQDRPTLDLVAGGTDGGSTTASAQGGSFKP